MARFGFLAALLYISVAVSASPANFARLASSLPRDAGVTHIAHDESRDLLIAYRRDGSMYGFAPAVKRDASTPTKREDAGTCVNLSVDEVKKIPGWKAVTQYAVDNWGNGKYELETNPKDFLDQPAQTCVEGEPIGIEKKGEPKCITQNSKTEGELVGTSGRIALSHWQGFVNTGSWTVTKSASFGVDVKVSATFKVPETFEGGVEQTTKASFENSLSKSFTTTLDTKQMNTLTVEAADGKKCHVNFKTNTCNVDGEGKIRAVAKGWVWFNYEDKTKDHYKWAVHLDEVVKNIEDRSSYIEFTGSMKSESYSEFKGVCQ